MGRLLTPEWVDHARHGWGLELWWPVVGLKLPLLPWAWKPLLIGFAVFHLMTVADVVSLVVLAGSHGAAIGFGGATIWIVFRQRTAAAEAKFRKDQVDAEIMYERVRGDAVADAERVRAAAVATGLDVVAKAQEEARLFKARTDAEIFRLKEETEKGATLTLLAEANEKIAENRADIDDLKARLAASDGRADDFAKMLAEAAYRQLHERNWAQPRGGEPGATAP